MDELKEYFHIAEIVKRPSRASFCLPGILFFSVKIKTIQTRIMSFHTKSIEKKHKR